MTHRIDTLVHAMEASDPGSLPGSLPGEPDALQLRERDEAVLPTRQPRNLPVNPPPTGRRPIYLIGFSPVGPGVGGWGGHCGSVAGTGARVVR